MQLVVFSSNDKFHSEIPIVEKMFKEGLETLHLRKPKFSTKDLDEYISSIPSKYHPRIILHSHHKLGKKYKIKGVHISRAHRKKKYNSIWKFLIMRIKHPGWVITRSCHRLSSLTENPKRYQYVFLSPIYDSISKEAHAGQFSKRGIRSIIEDNNLLVYALGGVDETKFSELKQLGFSGVALLGSVWNSGKNPLEVFISAKKNIDSIN